MVFDREQAARRAEAQKGNSNQIGMCQNWTWNIFGTHAVGDVDGDRDADAVDGWKSEPLWARHEGDRKPPRGVPLAWSGGSNGHGHRAVSLGGGLVGTIDAPSMGRVGIVPLAWFEQHWGLKYLGWSETISGVKIPLPPKPKPTRVQLFKRDAPRYKLKRLDAAVKGGRKGRVAAVRNALDKQMRSLPRGENGTVVALIEKEYRENRVIRLDLLNRAVKRGRVGTVKRVRDSVKDLIKRLPAR